MKKVIFLMAALLAVFSGIAAVSAYEGHMVDVKAHVENALMVETNEADFGTVFPQEAVESQFRVGLSQSFRGQERYSTVKYNMYWEPKPIGVHEVGIDDPENDGFFIPIWPFIEVAVDKDKYDMEDYIINEQTGLVLIGDNYLYLEGNECSVIHLILDPPVFDKWYNELTDPREPSRVLGPDYYYTTLETASCGFTADVPHTDLGSNFKIQVTDVVVDVVLPN